MSRELIITIIIIIISTLGLHVSISAHSEHKKRLLEYYRGCTARQDVDGLVMSTVGICIFSGLIIVSIIYILIKGGMIC